MYRFLSALGFGILILASCQNTPKTAADTPPAAETPAVETPAPQETPLTPEFVKETLSKLTSGHEQALSLRNQLDQLSASLKGKNKEAINALYNDLEGILVKEGVMIGDLKRAANGGEQASNATEDVPGNPVDHNAVKDYSESVERYNQLLRDMQQKIEAMKGGN